MPNAWLICREPVHIGGADSDSRGNQNPVYRMPDRTPAIPGSSLRGALREGAQHDLDPQVKGKVRDWFGGENSDNDNISPGGFQWVGVGHCGGRSMCWVMAIGGFPVLVG
ncbi:RAMP superfamily CRISPR-associated protein (plasmid) [Synechocystis sp. B12]|nr:RAMP superfamily CRISPR-associated protein [Synechocystis sp. B12]